MPIYSAKNLYPGVNPHLNSALQLKGGGWEMFHTEFITAIRRALDVHLPPNYYATSEKSLQLSEIGLDHLRDSTARPDISVVQNRETDSAPAAAVAAQPTLTLALDDALSAEEDYLKAVSVYEFNLGQFPGRLVTRIEMLSPANKLPYRSTFEQYLIKRLETLRAGVNLVEIDLLHTSRPILKALPSYYDNEADAFPYMILVSFPHQNDQRGYTAVYGIGVDDALPQVALPLAERETVAVNLGEIYNRLFTETRVFQLIPDYAAEPAQFERYQPQDRQRIRARMAQIAAAHTSPNDT